ncbi:substrate-binding domain of hmg-CoA reductase [Myriangium duriaei CBS 260.36]|uniref:hydroxymethylglutaryl-CoA reductase (NADPH) n=1 Tax=Myriangium duriaei CBS 260.36 TaxID=1168546 RepID=A0A9P4IUN6_9PEZI|nr:substrate-binding domain of hmg-CoA reductase [Myriangium duriaei CBS 260.36]
MKLDENNQSVGRIRVKAPLDLKSYTRAVEEPVTRQQRLINHLELEQRCPVMLGKAGPESVADVRIENPIGFVQIPVGLAGPLTILGKHQSGTFYAPLATTEAALVASCARGCKVFQKSGGIRAAALKEGMIRAPVFRFKTIDDAIDFAATLSQYEEFFRKSAEKTTRFGRLQGIEPHLIHNEVHVRFTYTCGDAGGQNMSTIATYTACHAFLDRYGAEHRVIDFMLEGQMSGDKKLALMNVTNPRGVSVVAWGIVSDKTSQEILGCTTTRLHRMVMTGRTGSMRAGMVGENANASNVLAALFVACGQDVGCIFEAGWAQIITSIDEDTKDMTLSLYIPSLPIATVGGGTGYATQMEALGLLGCVGEGKKWALAETIAAFALALEVSTIGAMSNDTFSGSHERLARK